MSASAAVGPHEDTLLAALAEFGAATEVPSQVRALKAVRPLMDGAPSSALLLPVAQLVEILVSPRAYSVHAALRACITACCVHSACAAALRTGLALRLRSLLCISSLWPQSHGVLRQRNEAVPGWLELLLDVPQLQPLMRTEAPRLLRLLSASLLAARRCMVESPADADAAAGAQEIGKVTLLLLKLCEPTIHKRSVAEIARALGGDVAAASDTDVRQLLLRLDVAPMMPPETTSVRGVGASEQGDDVSSMASPLCMLCGNALGVAMLQAQVAAADLVALSTALIASHLLCAVLDALLVPEAAVHHILTFIGHARARGHFDLSVALRGAAQGARTSTLAAAIDEPDRSMGEPQGCMLLGAVGGGILTLCNESVDATYKLFAFRAVEAILSHAEAAGALLTTPAGHCGGCNVPALRAFLKQSVDLLFDHWELSFQSLTNMLQPLLKRILKLDASIDPQGDGGHRPPAWLGWLLPQLRQLDWSRRAKYRALQVAVSLLPSGACTLLCEWPELVDECFSSLSIPNHVSQCELLLADVMKSLAAHISSEAGTVRRPGESSEAAWLRLVIAPLLTALRKSNANKVSDTTSSSAQTDAILHAALPSLLSAEPAALGWLLSSVSTINNEETAGVAVAVLRAARDVGLLSGEALSSYASSTTLMNGEPSPPPCTTPTAPDSTPAHSTKPRTITAESPHWPRAVQTPRDST